MTALKTALFIFFVPGTVAIAIPLWIILPLDHMRLEPGFVRWAALPLWVIGWVFLIRCAVDFVKKGGGTPAPVEPPRELVIDGLYRYTRNPMYVGVLLAVTGHVLWLGSPWMAGYALLLWLIIHVFVTTYEEPHLRKTFGNAYEQYCQRVPRWLFRF